MAQDMSEYYKFIEEQKNKPDRAYKVNVHESAVPMFAKAGFLASKDQSTRIPHCILMVIMKRGKISYTGFYKQLEQIAPSYLWSIPKQHPKCRIWNKR